MIRNYKKEVVEVGQEKQGVKRSHEERKQVYYISSINLPLITKTITETA